MDSQSQLCKKEDYPNRRNRGESTGDKLGLRVVFDQPEGNTDQQ
jgi:hypothetical protein